VLVHPIFKDEKAFKLAAILHHTTQNHPKIVLESAWFARYTQAFFWYIESADLCSFKTI
jgi:hypothetical protein